MDDGSLSAPQFTATDGLLRQPADVDVAVHGKGRSVPVDSQRTARRAATALAIGLAARYLPSHALSALE